MYKKDIGYYDVGKKVMFDGDYYYINAWNSMTDEFTLIYDGRGTIGFTADDVVKAPRKQIQFLAFDHTRERIRCECCTDMFSLFEDNDNQENWVYCKFCRTDEV